MPLNKGGQQLVVGALKWLIERVRNGDAELIDLQGYADGADRVMEVRYRDRKQEGTDA